MHRQTSAGACKSRVQNPDQPDRNTIPMSNSLWPSMPRNDTEDRSGSFEPGLAAGFSAGLGERAGGRQQGQRGVKNLAILASADARMALQLRIKGTSRELVKMTTWSYRFSAKARPTPRQIWARRSAWPEFRTRFHCKDLEGLLSLAASDEYTVSEAPVGRPIPPVPEAEKTNFYSILRRAGQSRRMASKGQICKTDILALGHSRHSLPH